MLPRDLFFPFYNRYFRKRLLALSEHALANFAVQALLRAVSDETHFGLILDEMLVDIETLLGTYFSLSNETLSSKTSQAAERAALQC